MAYLIAAADGNWTAAATWGAVDATSLLDSEAANTTLTTSYVESATFTPGAITIDGIAVKISHRIASTGTISVRLAQAGATVAGTEVTINVSDIPHINNASDGVNGWIFFKFAAPVLLLAATLYTVSAKTSSATQVALFRNATAGNWSRMLRTTTTAAPAAGDSMFVLGEWTAAATKTNRSVTMNETAATDYGGGSTTLASLGIGIGGTLSYGVAAATNYVLRLSGVLAVWSGGTFNIGTNPATGGTAIPRDSTAVLEFDCAADGDFGYALYGAATFRAYGLSRTADLNVVQCLLNTDEAIGQTVLGVDTNTGWLSGDTIAIAATDTTPANAETGTLNGNATATTVTISVALTAAHAGTVATGIQAEVILLTRNVMIRSVSSSFMAYGQVLGANATSTTGATVELSWVDFRYMGSSASVKNAAFHCSRPVASFSASYCCFRDSEGQALLSVTNTISLPTATIAFTDCVFYNIGITSVGEIVEIESSTGAACTVTMTRCTWIPDSTATNGGFFGQADDDTSWTLTSCRIAGFAGRAVTITGGNNYTTTKRMTGCVFHSCGQASNYPVGFTTNPQLVGVEVIDCAFWRNNVSGAGVGAITFGGNAVDFLIDGCTFIGCGATGAAVGFTTNLLVGIIRNCVFAGETTVGQARGVVETQSNAVRRLRYENCTFGVVTANRVAHGTSSLGTSGTLSSMWYELTLVNCNLADATEFDTGLQAGFTSRSFVARQRKDTTTNTHERVYPRLGTIAYDAATFRTAAPSEKLTPTVGIVPTASLAAIRLRSSPKRIPVSAGDAVSASCFVRKDSSYNGAQPRLVMLANPALGLDDDLTLDTMTGTHSQWEQLTGQQTPVAEEDGVVEVVVEVDGSAGNVYVDDWSASS